MDKVQKLQPRAFTRFCMSIAQVPSSYISGMTMEEQLLWFCSYLQNEVIPAVNNNAGAVEELQALYLQLKDYVDHYFDNLDVQEEINNKLDDMAESGALAEIINQEIFGELNDRVSALEAVTTNYGMVSYETMSDLLADENVVNNKSVLLLGKEEKDDGFGGVYRISDTAEDDSIALHNNLYATLINNYEENFINEIVHSYVRMNNTDIYNVYIPMNDSEGHQIDLYVGESHMEGTHLVSPMEYAQENLTTFTCNASLAIQDADTNYYDTLVIANGEIINPVHQFTNPLGNNYQYLTIDAERNFKGYQANSTDSSTLLEDGVQQAWLCFGQIVKDGVIQDLTGIPGYNEKSPQQCIGVKADGTVVVMTCDGRDPNNEGLTVGQVADIILNNRGCQNAWLLDGGGSNSTNHKTIKLNRSIDNNFTYDRAIKYTLNAKKTIINKNIADVYAQISKTKYEYNRQIMDTITSLRPAVAQIGGSNQTWTSAEDIIIPVTIGYSSSSSNISTYLQNGENGQINVKKAGTYIVNFEVQIESAASNNKFLYVFLNNTKLVINSCYVAQGQRGNFTCTTVVNANANDNISCRGDGASGDVISRLNGTITRIA